MVRFVGTFASEGNSVSVVVCADVPLYSRVPDAPYLKANAPVIAPLLVYVSVFTFRSDKRTTPTEPEFICIFICVAVDEILKPPKAFDVVLAPFPITSFAVPDILSTDVVTKSPIDPVALLTLGSTILMVPALQFSAVPPPLVILKVYSDTSKLVTSCGSTLMFAPFKVMAAPAEKATFPKTLIVPDVSTAEAPAVATSNLFEPFPIVRVPDVFTRISPTIVRLLETYWYQLAVPIMFSAVFTPVVWLLETVIVPAVCSHVPIEPVGMNNEVPAIVMLLEEITLLALAVFDRAIPLNRVVSPEPLSV